MVFHHTKNKSDLGVLKVKVDLVEQINHFKSKYIAEQTAKADT